MENIKQYYPPIETYIANLPAKRKASEMDEQPEIRKRPEPRVMNDALLERLENNKIEIPQKSTKKTETTFKPTNAFYGIVFLISGLFIISFKSNIFNFIRNLFVTPSSITNVL